MYKKNGITKFSKKMFKKLWIKKKFIKFFFFKLGQKLKQNLHARNVGISTNSGEK